MTTTCTTIANTTTPTASHHYHPFDHASSSSLRYMRPRRNIFAAIASSSSRNSKATLRRQDGTMEPSPKDHHDDDSESSMPYDQLVAVCKSHASKDYHADDSNDTRSTFKSSQSNGSSSRSLTITNDIFMQEEPGSSRTMLMADSADSFIPEDVSSGSITADEGDETLTANDDDEKTRTEVAVAEQAPVVVSTNVIPDTTMPNNTESAAVASKISKKKKSVSWSEINIYEHAIVLGDNPAVSSGPPICCGRKLLKKNTILINDYEALRPQRRVKAQLAVPRMDREDWLIQCGYGRSDIRQAVEEVQRIKKLRDKSAKVSVLERCFSKWSSNKTSLLRTRLPKVDESPAAL